MRSRPPPCTQAPPTHPALCNWSISTEALVVPVLKHHGSWSPRPRTTKAPVRQTAIQPSITPRAIVYLFTQTTDGVLLPAAPAQPRTTATLEQRVKKVTSKRRSEVRVGDRAGRWDALSFKTNPHQDRDGVTSYTDPNSITCIAAPRRLSSIVSASFKTSSDCLRLNVGPEAPFVNSQVRGATKGRR